MTDFLKLKILESEQFYYRMQEFDKKTAQKSIKASNHSKIEEPIKKHLEIAPTP